MKIYVASSWRNNRQPIVVTALKVTGHDVYDFRNPEKDNYGFHWSNIDPSWKLWTPDTFRKCLNHPLAIDGYSKDIEAMKWADVFVLIMPCGRSAHLELGWAIGKGKKTAILLSDGEPELMYKMVDFVAIDIIELAKWVIDC